ncbi:hypothetical protein Gohar_027245 [Gossypium harknessii]|uniref:RNase H type-1 domain-containing protein n=1 Tax=Gossypium harknessii TaxID=34285 RepID=A0A7J9HU24_9ROSI|nr:hypothetical protein [Gossypium harknessii]
MVFGTLYGNFRVSKECDSSERVLTNSERVRRGIGQDKSCHLCGHEFKDALHVLRDCPLDGLLLIQKQGYDEVVIQSNNLDVVKIVGNNKFERSNFALIRRNQQILLNEEKWFLEYILREFNKAANAITKIASLDDEDLHMFEDPPMAIKEILQEDSIRGTVSMNTSM